MSKLVLVGYSLGILTNARSANQRSMLGYGDLLLDNARRADLAVRELRAPSLISRLAPGRTGGHPARKLLANLDRFVTAPLAFAGKKADIVHVVDPGNVPYLDVIRHRASIVTVHDVIPYLCEAGRLEGFHPTATGRWLMRRILKRLARVDRIVCVSDTTRRDLLGLADLDPTRVVTIPNAVFQPMAPATPDECLRLRRRLGLPQDARIILHVGSSSFYKNRRTVLDVFARIAQDFPDTVLLFVGPRTPDIAHRLAATGLVNRVHFAPTVPRESMATVYSMASVVLFPSLYEGFGYPVLEAQLCGTPVVCSAVGALPEVAGEGALLADPRDVKTLVGAVSRLLCDPDLCARLCVAGTTNAARFSPEAWGCRHRALYAGTADYPQRRAIGEGLNAA